LKEPKYGWVGKTLRIDLSISKVIIEPTQKYADRFIGGRGVGQWILFNELALNIGALDPGNKMVFGTGPLTGTMAPSSRLSLDTKNVLTGGTLSSNCGGHFGPELKFAGFDFVIVQGKANRPVYVWINDGRAKINDASHLWGKSTWECEDLIRDQLRDEKIRVASIGLAGENLVKVACIIVDRSRAFGRGGSGAIMGSKNLKAIAVRGTGSIEVADSEGFMNEVDFVLAKMDKNESIQERRQKGTRAILEKLNDMCFFATRNFQDDCWDPKKIEKIKQSVFNDRYEVRKLSCFNCPIFCSHFYEVKDGPYAGLRCEGFQANMDLDYSSKLEIDDPIALIKINALCNYLGLDIDNTSGPIAWAFELWEKGIITEEETGGLELKWGDYETVIQLISKIAYRDGFGGVLAEGVKRASEIIGKGSERYAIHIKGQDSIESLRYDKGWALGCVVAPRGGGHLNGAFISLRFPSAGDPSSYEDKASIVFWFEKFKAVVDMLGICYFTTCWSDKDLLTPDDLARLFSKATGKEMGGEQLMRIGQQVHNVEKAFNTLHAGFKREDDYPPKRFIEEPIKSGPFKGERIRREKWERMLDEYYELHGWDRKTGWQTEECLKNLELLEVALKLGKAQRFPICEFS
jgi:aldehyde:ferredoxin oxidoreductase